MGSSSPRIGTKIKHIWNHNLVHHPCFIVFVRLIKNGTHQTCLGLSNVVFCDSVTVNVFVSSGSEILLSPNQRGAISQAFLKLAPSIDGFFPFFPFSPFEDKKIAPPNGYLFSPVLTKSHEIQPYFQNLCLYWIWKSPELR